MSVAAVYNRSHLFIASDHAYLVVEATYPAFDPSYCNATFCDDARHGSDIKGRQIAMHNVRQTTT